jgi:hypothetical protein
VEILLSKSRGAGAEKYPTYYDPIKIAATFAEISTDIIKTESENVTNRWFQGISGSDLLIWTDESQNIIKQQIIFCGQVAEWNILDGIKTGYVLEEETQGENLPSSETIKYDSSVQGASVQIALELLKNISVIEEHVRVLLIQHFEKPHSIQSLTSEELVKRYGNKRSNKAWAKFRSACQKLFS